MAPTAPSDDDGAAQAEAEGGPWPIPAVDVTSLEGPARRKVPLSCGRGSTAYLMTTASLLMAAILPTLAESRHYSPVNYSEEFFIGFTCRIMHSLLCWLEIPNGWEGFKICFLRYDTAFALLRTHTNCYSKK